MYHLRLKGKHYDIGYKRGNIFKKCNIVFPLNIDEYQLKHGIESEKVLKKYFPEVCEEIKGVTDALSIDYIKFSSWLLAMGCCMYNLEDNFPKEVRGCTAFSICYKGNVYYGRNNDLPPYLKEGSKSEIYKPIGANTFNITTSSFINGEEGMNDKGLTVAMTYVSTELKNIKPGFNSVFIVRYLLEKASSTVEAKNMLFELPIASNCNILLSDKNGDMLVVECTPIKNFVREPLSISKDLKVICTVNSFIYNEMKKYEMVGENTYRSEERYNNVINAFKKYNDENIVDYMISILKGNYGFMCQYKKEENFETIWSSIFDLNYLKILRAEGNPRRCKYNEDNRLTKS